MNALFKGMVLALLGVSIASSAYAARNLEVVVRDENGDALTGASVCLGARDSGGGVDEFGARRTDALGTALFENVSVNGASLRVNVTAPGYDGATRVLTMTNNHAGTAEPPQMQTVDLPGEGAECHIPGDPDPQPDPDPDPEPDPDPMPGGDTTTSPTPTKTFHFRTVDYAGRPVGLATVCAGDGPGEGGSLYGRAVTDVNGDGSIPGIPSGGDGYRRVTLSAVRGCENLAPTEIDGSVVYPCGVGTEFAQPDLASPTSPFLIVVGAVDADSADAAAGVAQSICPPPVSNPDPTAWRLLADDEVVENTTTTVSANILRGQRAWLMGWLYDFEWEVSDSSVLEIVGSARTGDRVTVKGKRPGTATVTARLARTDGHLASAPQGTTTITVTFAGGIDPDRSVAAFEEVQGVFTHPRCVNCHVAGDHPKQGNNRTAHVPDGRNQVPERGGNCSACHAEEPDSTRYEAPFVRGTAWRMPPADMAARMSFEDPDVVGQLKLPSRICNDIKESYRERNLCESDQECALRVADHIDHDGLVIWAFVPGGTRSPASMTGHGEFAAKIRQWAELGGFCPE